MPVSQRDTIEETQRFLIAQLLRMYTFLVNVIIKTPYILALNEYYVNGMGYKLSRSSFLVTDGTTKARIRDENILHVYKYVSYALKSLLHLKFVKYIILQYLVLN